jgi:hypothetical protein
VVKTEKPLSNCVFHCPDNGWEIRRFCPYDGSKMNVLVNSHGCLAGIALDKWWLCVKCRNTFKQGMSNFYSAEMGVRIHKYRSKRK